MARIQPDLHKTEPAYGLKNFIWSYYQPTEIIHCQRVPKGDLIKIRVPKFVDEWIIRDENLMLDSCIANLQKNEKCDHGMIYLIQSMRSLCGLEGGCHVNGVPLNEEDFGNKSDDEPDFGDEYGCGNMYFHPDEEPQAGVLEKYDINENQWRFIQDELHCLSFGRCAWCA